MDGIGLAASGSGSGVRSLKIRRTVSLVGPRIEGYRFGLQYAKRNMAGDRLKYIRPNQSLEPMARCVTPRAGHEARHLSPWLTIKR